jgi:hypothetical protein
MHRGPITFVVLSMLCTGCASTELKYSTISVSGSIGEIINQQVVANLVQAYVSPYAIPSQAVLSQGLIQIQNQASITTKLPYTVTRSNDKEIDPGLTFQWQEAWTIVPVMDAQDAARLEYLYVGATATLKRSQSQPEPPTSSGTSSIAPHSENSQLLEFPLNVYPQYKTERPDYGTYNNQYCIGPIYNPQLPWSSSSGDSSKGKQPAISSTEDPFQNCKSINALLGDAASWLAIRKSSGQGEESGPAGFADHGVVNGYHVWAEPKEFAQFVMFVLDATPNAQNTASSTKGVSFAVQ